MDPTEEDLSSCSWWLIYSEGYRKRQSSSSYEEAMSGLQRKLLEIRTQVQLMDAQT